LISIKRNQDLYGTIKSLKTGNEAVVALARNQLGLIGKGETYYLITGSKNENSSNE
jgi:cell division protein FtsB